MFTEGNHVFGVLKQNLEVDQRIIIGRTSSDLDGRTGTIFGKSFDNIADAYIILLDEPYRGQKAISLIESCISALKL